MQVTISNNKHKLKRNKSSEQDEKPITKMEKRRKSCQYSKRKQMNEKKT